MPVTAPPTAPGAAPPVPISTTPEATFDAQLETWHSYMRDDLQPYATAVAANVAANATDAAASATAASGSATTAGSHATNAGISATLAQNWAIQIGTPVSGGEYSAKHYAQQAAAAVAAIPAGTINDSTTSDTSVWSSSKVAAELGGKLNATSGTASGLTLNDGYTEEVFAVTGTTPALSPTNGSIQTWTLSGASTPTYGTWAAGQSIVLMITAGANTITWPTTTWSKVGGGGAAPTLTSSGATCVILWKVGTTTYGALLGSV